MPRTRRGGKCTVGSPEHRKRTSRMAAAAAGRCSRPPVERRGFLCGEKSQHTLPHIIPMCLMVGGVFFAIEQTRISVSGLTSRKQAEVFSWRAKKWMALPCVWLNRLNEYSSVSLCRLTLAHNAFPKEASWRAYGSDLHHPCNLECRRLLSLDELAGPVVDRTEEVGHVRQRPHQRVLVVASTTLERCPVEQLHCIVRSSERRKKLPEVFFCLFCKQLSRC